MSDMKKYTCRYLHVSRLTHRHRICALESKLDVETNRYGATVLQPEIQDTDVNVQLQVCLILFHNKLYGVAHER